MTSGERATVANAAAIWTTFAKDGKFETVSDIDDHHPPLWFLYFWGLTRGVHPLEGGSAHPTSVFSGSAASYFIYKLPLFLLTCTHADDSS